MKKELIFATLFSGSSGNAVYLSYGEDAILIDAGKNAKQVVAALSDIGENPEKIRGVFITHEHSDHTAALPVLIKKYRFPVYMNRYCHEALAHDLDGVTEKEPEMSFTVGPFEVTSFLTPHDSACSVGYTVKVAGKKLGIATDMGMVAKSVVAALQGCDAVIVECNYDERMLYNGKYPQNLKERIAGTKGHLSNEDGAKLAAVLAYTGTKQIVLGHLSKENNTPEKALQAVKREFEKRKVSASVAVAEREKPTVICREMTEETVSPIC